MEGHQNIIKQNNNNHNKNNEIINQNLSQIHQIFNVNNMTVIINKLPDRKNHKQIIQQMGTYYYLTKSYYYKQKVIIFILLDHLIHNHNKYDQKTKNQCQKIIAFFQYLLKIFNKKINKQVLSNIQRLYYAQSFDNIENLKQKFIIYLKKIKQKQSISIIVPGYPFDRTQIQLLLNIFIDCWKQKQSQSNLLGLNCSLFNQVNQILSGKLEIQVNKYPSKIIKLQIVSQNSTKQSLKYFLYKTIQIIFNNKIIAEIIQTNLEKYVYFKTYQITIRKGLKSKRISQLFQQKSREEFYQSQDQKNSSQNSQIIQDEQFFRISSKISNSQRKNSFNSGEIPTQQPIQNAILSQNHIQSLLKPQNQNKLLANHHTISQIYFRGDSASNKNNLNKNNLYTSIDLLLKIKPQELKEYQQKSCSNSRITKTTDSECRQSKLMVKWAEKIQLNLFNETSSKKYEQLYLGIQKRHNNIKH